MAELALVGSGPSTYQLWLGGSPDQAGRTGYATDIFKMKFEDLEATVEPIFAMWKAQRTTADEALGDFTYRAGWDAIKAFMEGYSPGDYKTMADPFAPMLLPTPDASVGIDSSLLSIVEAEAAKRDLDAPTLLDMILREAIEG
jgi:sulfite reductase (ferredoxin)